jgi:short-subunit dehydrogenase
LDESISPSSGYGLFMERDNHKDIEMIQLNIITLTNLMYLFLGDFIKKNNGKILNVSSSASLMPGPLQAVYFATKAYVKSLSNAVARELSDSNITITNLMPDLPILVFSLFTDARNLPSQFTIIYYTFMSEIKNVI